jgi:hypothetical protein
MYFTNLSTDGKVKPLSETMASELGSNLLWYFFIKKNRQCNLKVFIVLIVPLRPLVQSENKCETIVSTDVLPLALPSEALEDKNKRINELIQLTNKKRY